MAERDNGFAGGAVDSGWDSGNSTIVEVSGGVEDTTIRPVRESLRKYLQLPASAAAQAPPREEKKT